MRRANPAVILALATACGVIACSTPPRRSEAERAADANTTALVEAALIADPVLFARHIDVSVDRGVVHLGGYVWSSEDFYLAERDARSVPGVISVLSQVELMRGGRAGGR